MMEILSVNKLLLTIWGYPLSYIEFVGTVLYFASVFLIARKNILTWPIGIISVILYGILFYQIQLYSDMMEQLYYLVISVIGWITWRQQKKDTNSIPAAWSKTGSMLVAAGITVACTAILAYCVANFHLWLPRIFPAPASYPILDALTTVMSFTAMLLTTRRKMEGWVYWIIVDIMGIGLYWVKDVRFIALQYVFLLGMAAYGLIFWLRQGKADSDHSI
jgi:nicotinamide mononucleotide transporter